LQAEAELEAELPKGENTEKQGLTKKGTHPGREPNKGNARERPFGKQTETPITAQQPLQSKLELNVVREKSVNSNLAQK